VRLRPSTRTGLSATQLVASGAVLLLAGACGGAERVALDPGFAVEREIGGGRPLRLAFPLAAGELVEIVVEQRGIDVVVTLRVPDGAVAFEIDSPTGAEGEERVVAVAHEAGRYELEVRPLDASARGRVVVRCTARRSATAADRRRAAALAAWHRAELRRLEDDAAAAVTAYRSALGPLAAYGDESLLDQAYWSLGEALALTGERREAAAVLETALRRYRVRGDPWGEARVATDLGDVYRGLGRAVRGEELFERSLTLYRELESGPGIATALNNLGLAAADRGEFGRAMARYREAAEAWRALEEPWALGRTLQNLGSLYVRLGRFPEGLDHLRRAAELLADDPRGRLGATVELGWVELVTGDAEAALTTFDEAARQARGLGDPVTEAAVAGRRGSALRELGRLDEAEVSYRRSLALLRSAGGGRGEGVTLSNLARLALERGRAAAARWLYTEAIDRFVDGSERSNELHARVGLGQALRALGELDAARAELERAVRIAERIRDELAGDLSRVHFFATRRIAYDELAALHVELDRRAPGTGHTVRALEIADRARGRMLLDSLTPADAPSADASETDPLLATVRRLEARQRDLLDRGPADPRLPALAERLRSLWLEIERRDARRHDPYPGLGADEIRALLDPETLLVLYQVGEGEAFAWTVDPERVEVHPLGPGREIERLARWAAETVREGAVGAGELQSRLALARLSDAVLGPLASRLAGRDRLALVLDGPLHLVPFAALPSPEPAAAGAPLVSRHTLVHLASAGVLARQRGAVLSGRPAGEIAVLADPVYEATDERLDVASAAAPLRLERLRATRDEAAAALRGVPRSRRLAAFGFDVDRELALSGRLAGYRTLHIAVHGLVSSIHPSLSSLALSSFRRDGTARDPFLFAHEIAGLDLPADLVVLSACETALGHEIRGEGLVGLTHAFLRAGARGVVGTLWKVEDRPAAAFAETFYEALRGDRPHPAEALRLAQLRLRREAATSAPAHWAAYTFHGDWRASPNLYEPMRVEATDSPTNRPPDAAGGRGKETAP